MATNARALNGDGPSEPSPTPAPSRGRRDRGLYVFVAAVAAAGLAGVGWALVSVLNGGQRPPLWLIIGIVAVFAAAESKVIQLRFGHNQHLFTLVEAAVVLGLVLAPTPWLVLLVTTGALLNYLVTRTATVKLVFNAGELATGAFIALTVFKAFGGGLRTIELMEPTTWLPLVIASFAFFLWQGVTVASAIALSQGLNPFGVYREGFLLNLFVWAGNTGLGIAVAIVIQSETQLLLFAPAIVLLLGYSYASYRRAMVERDTWQTLEAASREVSQLSRDAMARAVLLRAEQLFRAEVVELLVADHSAGEAATLFRRTAQSGVIEIVPNRKLGAETEAGPGDRIARWYQEPLEASGEGLGALRVGFFAEVPFKPRDLKVLTTFANQVATAARNTVLYDDIEAERNRLSQIVDGSSDGILAVDGDCVVHVWNPAMMHMTGFSAAAAKGRRVYELMPAVTDTGERFDATAWHAAIRSTAQNVLVNTVDTDRSGRWLQLSMGRPSGDGLDTCVVIVRDVTAQRQLDEAKGDFLATISHELRTPLTPLIGFLKTMKRRPEAFDASMLADAVERMLLQAKRLERLINDVLAVSQMDGGDLSVEPELCDMNEIVERAATGSELFRSGRPLTVETLPGGAPSFVDPVRMEQILGNLLSNARRYTPPEAVVTVTVSARPGSKEVLVQVADGGPGIPKDKLDVIFERFTRLGHHLTRVQGGTGLGLYIVKRLVESMHGRVWADSAPGEGATFFVVVPPATSDAATGAAATSRAARPRPHDGARPPGLDAMGHRARSPAGP